MGKKADALQVKLDEANKLADYWRAVVEEVSYALEMPGSPELTSVVSVAKKVVAENKAMKKNIEVYKSALKSAGWLQSGDSWWSGSSRV